MIELLIVIAVLGILAVAVLSAINPIEQINRSKDTGSRSDSEQLIGAVDRFYSSKGYYPWQSGAADAANATALNSLTRVGNATANTLTNGVLGALSGGTGEIKEAFVSRITKGDYNYLYIYNKGSQGSSTYVCFLPKSNSFESDAQNRCAGGMPADFEVSAASCNAGDVTNNAYSCLP